MNEEFKTIMRENTEATKELTHVVRSQGEKIDFQTNKLMSIVSDRSVVPLRIYLISMIAIIMALAGSKVLEKAIAGSGPLVERVGRMLDNTMEQLGIPEPTFARDSE